MPDRSAPACPPIREWTEAHFASPATSPASTRALADREALRAELGYRHDEKVCVVAVGGSGVGSTCSARWSPRYPWPGALVRTCA